jgi:hypothetical protein
VEWISWRRWISWGIVVEKWGKVIIFAINKSAGVTIWRLVTFGTNH